jgi:hypothetical protein
MRSGFEPRNSSSEIWDLKKVASSSCTLLSGNSQLMERSWVHFDIGFECDIQNLKMTSTT